MELGEPIMVFSAVFILGFFCGSLVGYLFFRMQRSQNTSLTKDLLQAAEKLQLANYQHISEDIKSSFKNLSYEALSYTTQSLVKLTDGKFHSERENIQQELAQKKSVIDQQVERMSGELFKVRELVQNLEKDRENKFGEISTLISNASKQTGNLLKTTNQLQNILTNSNVRGQWGERLAEDVIRLFGFIENVNYVKQKTLPSGLRPDFTFYLPKNAFLHMEVKFPLQNYVRALDSLGEEERAKYDQLFLNDVRLLYKEIHERKYHESSNSVDCVLLLIPHEQIFSFLLTKDQGLVDYGLKHKIITCSPMTLFSVLAIIRKSVDHFMVEATSQEILLLLNEFKKQWETFGKSFIGVGKKISDLEQEFEKLQGVRSRQLDKILNQIEQVKLPSSIQ